MTVVRIAAALVGLVLGVGCTSAEDPLDALTVVEPARAGEAQAIAVAGFELELGIAMPEVAVTWVAERIPYRDATVIGLHRGCDDIWLTWWEGPAFSRLALAHELGHCARVASGIESDQGHVDAAWWAKDGAGVVDRVNRRLVAAGL